MNFMNLNQRTIPDDMTHMEIGIKRLTHTLVPKIIVRIFKIPSNVARRETGVKRFIHIFYARDNVHTFKYQRHDLSVSHKDIMYVYLYITKWDNMSSYLNICRIYTQI